MWFKNYKLQNFTYIQYLLYLNVLLILIRFLINMTSEYS